MTAMRAEELPAELATGVPGAAAGIQPEESAASRAAVRWTRPAPAAGTLAYGLAPVSPVSPWPRCGRCRHAASRRACRSG